MGETRATMQIKGCSFCIDVVCKCGHHFHVDGEFLFFVQCPHCETIYKTGDKIELQETAETPSDFMIWKG